jgi:hypothetical protein
MNAGNISLLPSIVLLQYNVAEVCIIEITKEEFLALLPQVKRNCSNHPVTLPVLKAECPTLPEKNEKFWDGVGTAIAAMCNSDHATTTGDITINDFRFFTIDYFPQPTDAEAELLKAIDDAEVRRIKAEALYRQYDSASQRIDISFRERFSFRKSAGEALEQCVKIHEELQSLLQNLKALQKDGEVAQ